MDHVLNVELEHIQQEVHHQHVLLVNQENIHQQDLQVVKHVQQENIVVQVQQVVQHVLLELIQLQDHLLVQNAKQVSIPA